MNETVLYYASVYEYDAHMTIVKMFYPSTSQPTIRLFDTLNEGAAFLEKERYTLIAYSDASGVFTYQKRAAPRVSSKEKARRILAEKRGRANAEKFF